MGCQFTNAIRDEQAEVVQPTQSGEPPAINRAAWPSGPLLSRTIVSHRSGPAVIYDPMVAAKTQAAPEAA